LLVVGDNTNNGTMINRNQKSLSFEEGFRVRSKKKRCEKRLGRKALPKRYQKIDVSFVDMTADEGLTH
jgi:hypothetical protein